MAQKGLLRSRAFRFSRIGSTKKSSLRHPSRKQGSRDTDSSQAVVLRNPFFFAQRNFCSTDPPDRTGASDWKKLYQQNAGYFSTFARKVIRNFKWMKLTSIIGHDEIQYSPAIFLCLSGSEFSFRLIGMQFAGIFIGISTDKVPCQIHKKLMKD